MPRPSLPTTIAERPAQVGLEVVERRLLVLGRNHAQAVAVQVGRACPARSSNGASTQMFSGARGTP